MDTSNDGSLDWGEFSSALKRLAGLDSDDLKDLQVGLSCHAVRTRSDSSLKVVANHK